MQGVLMLSRAGEVLIACSWAGVHLALCSAVQLQSMLAVLLCCSRNTICSCARILPALTRKPVLQQGVRCLMCGSTGIKCPITMYAMLAARVQGWMFKTRRVCCAHVQPQWRPFVRWIPLSLGRALQLQAIVAGQQRLHCSATCTSHCSERRSQGAQMGDPLRWQM
jgi:hypothetical protein